MNQYLIIAALLAIMGAGAGGFKLGVDHEKAGQVSKQEAVAEAVDAANNVWADKVASLKPTYTTIQNKVQHEVETHTVYTDCKLSPDGLLLANQALAGGAKPVDQSKLPSPDAAGK
jgi:hypothetical protein